MEVHLPSGNTVQFRDNLGHRGMREARRSLKAVTSPDGSRVTSADVIDDMRLTIYRITMLSWSFAQACLSSCGNNDLAERMLDQHCSDNDLIALARAVQPWVDLVLGDIGGSDRVVVDPETGLRFTAASEEDAARAVATGRFTAAGPKATGSGSTRNGSSPAALPGGLTAEETAPTP